MNWPMTWAIIAVAVCSVLVVVYWPVKEPQPVFTDAIAQRIWAANHGNCSTCSYITASIDKILKQADTVKKDR